MYLVNWDLNHQVNILKIIAIYHAIGYFSFKRSLYTHKLTGIHVCNWNGESPFTLKKKMKYNYIRYGTLITDFLCFTACECNTIFNLYIVMYKSYGYDVRYFLFLLKSLPQFIHGCIPCHSRLNWIKGCQNPRAKKKSTILFKSVSNSAIKPT